MKFYLKWTLIILGPFALAVAGFIYWQYKYPDSFSRDELDESYNRDQVERLQHERQEKRKLDDEWRQRNK